MNSYPIQLEGIEEEGSQPDRLVRKVSPTSERNQSIGFGDRLEGA